MWSVSRTGLASAPPQVRGEECNDRVHDRPPVDWLVRQADGEDGQTAMNTITHDTSDQYHAVISAALIEVTRQETRVDIKAGQLMTLAGTLSTLAVAAASAIGAAMPHGLLWCAAPLLLAAVLWAVVVVVLLRGIIRPHLAGRWRGTFAHPDHARHLRGMSLIEYQETLVTKLGGLVARRYRAARLAADLLVAGFVPLLATGVTAVVVAVR